MSLLLSHPSKPLLVRSSPLRSNGLSSPSCFKIVTRTARECVLVRSSPLQTPPCYILHAREFGAGEHIGKLIIANANGPPYKSTNLEKKVPMELTRGSAVIACAHGWVVTSKDGRFCLQDDLNPYASDTDPRRIRLPPLVTLPHCQTRILTNMSMSSPSLEEDCVVVFKFLGPQLSFWQKARRYYSEWINIRIKDPCFFSSRVMFFKKDGMFHIPGSGGNIIGSWDLRTNNPDPKLQVLRFHNLPELTETVRELLHCVSASEHLVESITTGETFMVKWYRETYKTRFGRYRMKTQFISVFRLDEKGNAVYTRDIGDLCIFLSKSEPFCLHASSFPGIQPNTVKILDDSEHTFFKLDDFSVNSLWSPNSNPYYIPPQNVSTMNQKC